MDFRGVFCSHLRISFVLSTLISRHHTVRPSRRSRRWTMTTPSLARQTFPGLSNRRLRRLFDQHGDNPKTYGGIGWGNGDF